MRRVEVAVVGAGVTGLSVAYFLRELGVETLVVERSGIAAGASGVQPGGVRQQWATRVNCVLARESVAFYRARSEERRVGKECRFRWSTQHSTKTERGVRHDANCDEHTVNISTT